MNLYMKVLSILLCWYSIEVKTNDTTSLYVEVINPVFIDFTNDYGSNIGS
jgi:hypothetical protein